MNLVARGRLSVQRVEENAWETIQLLAENGGWEELDLRARKTPTKGPPKVRATRKPKVPIKTAGKKKKGETTDEEAGDDSPLSSLDSDGEEEALAGATAVKPSRTASRKRKVPADNEPHNNERPRRSNRRKVAN